MRLLTSLAVLLSFEAIALADTGSTASIASFDPDNAVAPDSSVEGHGVKIGEGTVLHPVFGVETGVISNVFYTNANTQAAGVLRLLIQLSTGSLDGARLAPANETDSNIGDSQDFTYRASLRATYDAMLSGNSDVTSTGGLGLGAQVRGMVNPIGRWSFGFSDDFTRLIRANNFETDVNTNRDINVLTATLLYHPRDRAFGGFLYYTNTIDVFEEATEEIADRLQHRVGLHPTWQWLPETQVYGDVSMGYYTGIADSRKVDSYPLSALLGISTLLSLKTTLSAQAGYTNGFYAAGPSFSAPTIDVSLGYRYSPLGRAMLTYDWVHQDSVNANYYRDHTLRLWVQQQIGPLVAEVQPELHLREYNGVDTIVMGANPTRDDTIFSIVAGAHYNFRDWFAAVASYRFTNVSTDYTYMLNGETINPSYARHELLLGVRAAL